MNLQTKRWPLVVAASLLWILIVYPAYYVVHKPLGPQNLRALVNSAGDLLVWLAILGVALGLGSRLTRRLAYHSLLERLIFSTGLGLGVFSLTVLGLSLLGLLNCWLLWTLLVMAGLLLWREYRDLARSVLQTSWSLPHDAWGLFLLMFVALSLVLALLLSLTPPIEWDALTYHLVGPDRYIQAGRLTFDFDIYYLFFPSFTEMLFTAGMALKSDVVPRLIHFAYLPLTLGALVAYAKRHWEQRLGLVAAALFLSIPTAVQISSWAYVDLALTFYAFASFSALFNWLQTQSSWDQAEVQARSGLGWLILAGLFCGACASIKYTGLAVLLAMVAVMLWTWVRKRLPARQLLSGGAVLVALSLVVAGPWYLKNAIVTGNPVYPLIWDGRGWNEISDRWLLVLGDSKSVLDLLLIPWTLTVLGQQGTVAYDATISPVFLLLLPLLLFVRRESAGIGALLVMAIVGYVAWIASGAAAYGTFVLQGRMLLPVFASLSLLSAYALRGMRIWDRKILSLERLLVLLVALTLALGLLSQVLVTTELNPMPYITGFQSRAGYQDEHITQRWNQARSFVKENLTSSDKILFIWEPRSYGYRVPHEPDPLFDNFSQRAAVYSSAGGIAKGIQDEGFTHVLVNRYIYPWVAADYPITPDEIAIWEEFEARHLAEEAVVYSDGEYLSLYRLSAAVRSY